MNKHVLVALFIFSFIFAGQIARHIHILQAQNASLKGVIALQDQTLSRLEKNLSGKEVLLEVYRKDNRFLSRKVLLLEKQNEILQKGIGVLEQSVAFCSERIRVLSLWGGELEVGLEACQVQLIEFLTPQDPGGDPVLVPAEEREKLPTEDEISFDPELRFWF